MKAGVLVATVEEGGKLRQAGEVCEESRVREKDWDQVRRSPGEEGFWVTRAHPTWHPQLRMNEPDRCKGMQVPVDLDFVHRLRAQTMESLGKSRGRTAQILGRTSKL